MDRHDTRIAHIGLFACSSGETIYETQKPGWCSLRKR